MSETTEEKLLREDFEKYTKEELVRVCVLYVEALRAIATSGHITLAYAESEVTEFISALHISETAGAGVCKQVEDPHGYRAVSLARFHIAKDMLNDSDLRATYPMRSWEIRGQRPIED